MRGEWVRWGIGVWAMVLSVASLAAGESPVVGWRGDGTGCYPKATPPLEWSRVSKTLKDLSAQAQKPKRDAPGGQSVADGTIHDWLVLGPVPAPEGAKLSADFLPNEAQLQPDENEKSGDLTWKAIKSETSCLEFNTLLGKHLKSAAYAHTYLYIKEAHPVLLAGSYHNGLRCWLNGKEVALAEKAWSARVVLNLTAGWNRLLLKVVPDAAPDGGTETQWYFTPQLFGRGPYEYEDKNIAWTCAMPGASHASPIVVGDKIFSTAETYDLVCINKADGKILWVRSANYFETLTEEEVKANPALQEAAPWAARIREINKAYSTATPPDGKIAGEKRELEKKLYASMLKVDNKKYKLLDGQDPGYAGITPVSDGKFVYVWYATGITVCYDLDGNRKWIHLDNDGAIREHGLATTPVLSGGKLIVHMNETLGLDAATGAVAWRLPREFFQASLLSFTIGNEPVYLVPNGSVRRASDGKALFERKGEGTIPSPVVKDGVIYLGTETFKVPASAAEPFKLEPYKPAVNIPKVPYPQFYGGWTTSSPLVHDGLLYTVSIDGALSVVDIEAGKVLYQKLLDVNLDNHHNLKAVRGLGSSPALAGKYVYIFGNQGTCVVLEAGRTFKQVGKNRIENSIGQDEWWGHQESSVSSPVFDGDRLYYRAEANLYCIGGK
ncbi:MAG: PQQ-binding-like beta-propeller repeat protein [Planctomycetes bacterium]|nr:PQQ-binding-like beta-propeller repeat protein [Planctomycetota bacterium]